MKAKIIQPDLKNSPGLKTFSVENVQQTCPFKTTFIIPGQITGQSPSVMQQPCESSCPLCSITNDSVLILCGSSTIKFEVENNITPGIAAGKIQGL